MVPSEDTLARAVAGAQTLKAGTWASVEALALLAIETEDRGRLSQAQQAAAGLKGAGSWEAVRALAVLARAERLVN